MKPPERFQKLQRTTHILNAAIWQLAVPFVQQLADPGSVRGGVYLNHRVDDLLFANRFDDVSLLLVDLDGIARVNDLRRELFNLRETCFQTILSSVS
jgi:hypothetical protein